MTYTVYGLRLKGEVGAKYVGQTAKPIGARLRIHVSEAKAYGGWNPTRFQAWLRANPGQVEAFPISQHDTREAAVAGERAAVEMCIALGHDLLQRSLTVAARKRVLEMAA